jgi:hypothetical protein
MFDVGQSLVQEKQIQYRRRCSSLYTLPVYDTSSSQVPIRSPHFLLSLTLTFIYFSIQRYQIMCLKYVHACGMSIKCHFVLLVFLINMKDIGLYFFLFLRCFLQHCSKNCLHDMIVALCYPFGTHCSSTFFWCPALFPLFLYLKTLWWPMFGQAQ